MVTQIAWQRCNDPFRQCNMKGMKVNNTKPIAARLWPIGNPWKLVIALWCVTILTTPFAYGQEHQGFTGHLIPDTSFKVFLSSGKNGDQKIEAALGSAALDTVVQALTILVQHRPQYKRFDQALTKDMLQKVVIEQRVLNREGKEFPFLVARTKHKGKVKLLVNATRLEQDGYLNNPNALAPRLAKEFQWVISKASTKHMRKGVSLTRNLSQAPIQSNSVIRSMSAAEREQALLGLLGSYIHTIDAFGSLTNQPHFELGTTNLVDPEHSDSTEHFYDIRTREALQLIVKDSYFLEHTPKAVRSLLNGKVWQVIMAKIDDRDWTTRTRVAPKDKAVEVGGQGKLIQPAKILVNYHRAMEREEDLYEETQGLPMGALFPRQLAQIIAWEIQTQITEKSLRGHVAEDEKTRQNH